jgi:hypothetical protein
VYIKIKGRELVFFQKNILLNRAAVTRLDIFVCVLLTSIGCMFAIYNFNKIFSDFHVYITGLTRYHNGINPYDNNDLFMYAFPPIISMALRKGTIIFLTVFLYIYSFIMFYRIARRNLSLFAFASIGLFAGECGQSWISGNISFPFHLALSATALEYAKKNNTSLKFNMALLIIISSVFKFYFLSYIIIFAIPKKIPFLTLFIIATLVIFAYAAQILLTPDQWNNFVNAVRVQAIDRMDSGFTVYSNLLKMGHPVIGLILHWLLLAVPAAIAIFSYRCGLFEINRMVISAYLLAISILANPRLKEYDAYAVNFSLYYVIYFFQSKKSFCENIFLRLAPLALTAYELAARVALHFNVINIAWPERSYVKEIEVYFLFFYTSWSVISDVKNKFNVNRSRSIIHKWLTLGSQNKTMDQDRP